MSWDESNVNSNRILPEQRSALKMIHVQKYSFSRMSFIENALRILWLSFSYPETQVTIQSF